MATEFSTYLLHASYGIQGIVIFLANGLLLLTIFVDPTLRKRKEMHIIACLAGADVIYGLGSILISLYRIIILLLGQENVKSTAWDCMILPPIFTTYVGTHLTAAMNVVVSVDRLIAVAWPITYRNLDKYYIIKVLVVVGTFGLVSTAIILLSSYFFTLQEPVRAMSTMLCLAPTSPTYYTFFSTFNATSSFASVVIYICVFVVHHKSLKKVAPNATMTVNQRAIMMQRRLTMTVGFITLSTFLLFTVPHSVLAVYSWLQLPTPFSQLFATISRISTISNVVIYVYRQRDTRKAMWSLVRKLARCNFQSETSVHQLSEGAPTAP